MLVASHETKVTDGAGVAKRAGDPNDTHLNRPSIPSFVGSRE